MVGSPGTGKTLLGLHFALEGVRAGEPTIYLGFHETERQLLLKADAFVLGPELRAALAPNGGLTILRRAPIELNADILADELLAALDRTGARRLVVDSIAELDRAVSENSDARRVPNYVAAVVEALRTRGVTTLFTKESGTLIAAELDLTADLVSVVAANVIWLQHLVGRGQFRRVLSVPKMRYSWHEVTLREVTIAAPAGIQVLAPFESDHEALADIAPLPGESRSGRPPDAAADRDPGRGDAPAGATPEPALVLIAEDEEPIAETVSYVVEDAGCTPLVAFDGRQALELARARRPALLIIDLMLPHVGGAELIAALRADAAASGQAAPPIILMTAASPSQARAAGADVVLRKPFELVALEALLRRFLGPWTPAEPTGLVPAN